MDAIIAVDQKLQIIAFNPAAEQMFGISTQRAVGHSLDRFIPPRFRAIHEVHVGRFLETGVSYRRMGALGSISALRANGEEFPVEASISNAVVEGEHFSTVILRDISERRANEATLMLAREVDHRAKNILSIISSLIALTPAKSLETYIDSLAGRVAAMSRANALLAAKRWTSASLARLIRDELHAHAGAGQIDAEGPDLSLVTRTAQPISMILHELATNALKHGALSVPEGRVTVRWSLEPGGGLRLIWRERAGPAVRAPAREGFGMTLLRQIVDIQLEGSHSLDWNPFGLEFEAIFPADVLQVPSAGKGPPDMNAGLAAPAPVPTPNDEEPTGNLLIVEDEPLLAMQMAQELQKLGWSIFGIAGSIDSANRLLGTSPQPDVAILDVDVGGASVFPIARALRRAGISFIFCTGFEDIGYTREFADCPVVRKPATAFQIVTALRQVVANGAADTA